MKKFIMPLVIALAACGTNSSPHAADSLGSVNNLHDCSFSIADLSRLARRYASKRQLFSYIEKSEGFLGLSRRGYVNTLFEAKVAPALSLKLDEIKKANPNAKFAPITIYKAAFLPHNSKWLVFGKFKITIARPLDSL